MKKLTILCDADDTIQELTSHWIEELNHRYNCNVKKEEITTWDMTKAYPNLSYDKVLAPLYRDDFWNKTTPIDGSRYYLEKLSNDGHNLLIVTASNLETFDAKRKRLMELFPFVRKEQIIREDNKQRIQGDVLIDDGAHNLINGKFIKFLYHRANNSKFDESKYGITRVYSWKEIYERICAIAA